MIFTSKILEGCKRKRRGKTNIMHGIAVRIHEKIPQKFVVPRWYIITGLLIKAIAEMYVTAIDAPKSTFIF